MYKVKIKEINSLSDYIENISKYNLKNYISRGENYKYEKLVASAFRYSYPVKFYQQINEFYNIIGNNITNMQRDNFVAFSQHHGIPTNLIDFSRSPLVSLFFACYDNKGTNENGYVYFIDNTRLIKVNERVVNNNILQMLLELKSSSITIIEGLYKYCYTHVPEITDVIISFIQKLKNNPDTQKKYESIFKLVDRLRNNEYDIFDNRKKIINKLVEINENDIYGITDFSLPDDCIEKFCDITYEMREKTQYVFLDLILLLILVLKIVISELYDFSWKKEITNIELPFYFSYCPPNIITRVNNQSSLFIYQLYYDDSLSDYYIDDTENRIIQSIIPDYIFKIYNQNDILNDLDMMGINLKYIYNDYDNIAKYIKNKNVIK